MEFDLRKDGFCKNILKEGDQWNRHFNNRHDAWLDFTTGESLLLLQHFCEIAYCIDLTVFLSCSINTSRNIINFVKPHPNILAGIHTLMPSGCSLELQDPLEQDDRPHLYPILHLPLGGSVSCARDIERLVSTKWGSTGYASYGFLDILWYSLSK